MRDLKITSPDALKMVTSTAELQKMCDDIEREAESLETPFIALDTEFLREKTYWPQLCLLQIGFQDQVWIVDPLVPEMDLSPFWKLLQNQMLTKVLHSARQDLEIFYHQTGRIPTPLFDTQIAAMVCGYQDSVGYDTLVRDFLGLTLDKSSRRTDWSQRPLSPDQLAYAASDVRYLVHLYPLIYQKLSRQKRLSWIQEDIEALTRQDTYNIPLDQAYLRLKAKKKSPRYLESLRRLAAWREQEAKTSNWARSFVLKDDTLQDLALMMPRNLKEASKIPSVKRSSLGQNRLNTLIALLEEARQTPLDQCPSLPNAPARAPNRQAILFLKLLLSKICLDEKIAEKLVATSRDLETFVLDLEQPNHPLRRGWRWDLFGSQADALLKGQRLAVFENQQIVFQDRSP